MESAALRRAPLNGPAEAGLVAILLLAAAGAWVLTDERMGGMDAGPGTDLGGVGWFIVVWVTMMAAMMLPSFAPAVLAYARIREEDRHGGRVAARGATPLFIAGYLLVWAAVGVVGYVVIEGLRALDPGLLAWEEGGRYIAGGAILGAALYQLTPLKDVCLRHCRRPQKLLLRHPQPDHRGAVAMGVEHGALCVGCCWGLMAVLFAVGVMSITWMFLVAALIAAEKLLPWRGAVSRGIAVLFVVLGLGVAFAPEEVPALTIPGSPAAMEGMEMEPGGAPMEDRGEMKMRQEHGGASLEDRGQMKMREH
jgi:predicted metal-binding membrane protein